MKLLVYGGCHALILKRLIDELGPGHHRVDLLVNFQLVASGRPFPYERLGEYDAVVYSPIQNRGPYNTVLLDEACAAAGVQAIRFPWLEWHGYAPGADKAPFWGHHGWFFPGLIDLARQFRDGAAFARHARAEFPDAQVVADAMAHTTERLVDQEERFDCHVRVSDFILTHFRERRLFLIPDHPTTLLYRHVLEAIERVAGTRLVASWPADLPELQPEERTPILPRVAALNDLAFADTTWRSETQPLGAMDLDAFLALHFEAARRDEGEATETLVATAARPTWANPVGDGAPQPSATGPAAVPIFAQVLMRRRPPAADDSHFTGDVLAALSAHAAPDAHRRDLGGTYRFRTADWTFRS